MHGAQPWNEPAGAPQYPPAPPPYQRQYQPPQYQPAPPQQQPPQYQPAPQYQPVRQQPDAGPPPRRPRRRGTAGLTAAVVVAVVLVVAIVAVAVVRQFEGAPATGTGSGPTGGPLDTCLVGRWKQSHWQADYDFTGLAPTSNLGVVKMSGNGRQWTVAADGTAIEHNDPTVYKGTARDGRAVQMTYTGSTTWRMTTAAGKIDLAGLAGATTLVIAVDGRTVDTFTIEPITGAPVRYACAGDMWRTLGNTESDFSRYERQA